MIPDRPMDPPCGDGVVRIFLAKRIDGADPWERRRHLSPRELARAGRFLLPRAREQFEFTRSTVRCVVGRCIGCPPGVLDFDETPLGKPYLAWPRAPICFSASHSGDHAAVAVTWGGEIGVDLERHRERGDLARLAAAACTPEELAAWRSRPPAERLPAFHDVWVCKEAVLKALGVGLTIPPSAVAIPPPSTRGGVVRRGGHAAVHVALVEVEGQHSLAVAQCGRALPVSVEWLR